MLIVVDVDGTVANMLPVWLMLYNLDYGDNLESKDIIAWEIDRFVLPSCGKKIYEYLDRPDLYDRVLPFPGAISETKRLAQLGHRVVFASAGISGAPAKLRWLKKWSFDVGEHDENFVAIYDKSLLRGDLLIDDRDKNIKDFGSPKSILVDAPHNHHFNWLRRGYNWYQITDILLAEFAHA